MNKICTSDALIMYCFELIVNSSNPERLGINLIHRRRGKSGFSD